MKLVFKYLLMHLKSQLEYKSSFILSFLAQIFPIGLSACMVFVLIDRFNFGARFNTYEVMLGIAIVQFGFSFSEFLGRGFDKFSEIIKRGNLDLMLIRPRNIYIQVFGSRIEFAKMSRVIGSIVLFVIAINHINFDKSITNILLLSTRSKTSPATLSNKGFSFIILLFAISLNLQLHKAVIVSISIPSI